VKRLVQNIAICFPIVIKLAVILFMITYIYGAIGMEIFHKDFVIHETSEYVPVQYTSFDTIGEGILSMLQVICQSGWAMV